ncbi:MAG: hypothetical protein JWN35_1853 [Frankiales bacterium]|jgi:hypothetical protein|nr:hypothetical protein [Frankiales bacterium]
MTDDGTLDNASSDGEAVPGDLDQLLSAAIEAASRMLSADGEFYPFAVAMTDGGELVSPAVDPEDERPDADKVVDLLVEALRDGREMIRAAAVVSDVTMAGDAGQERDAIRVELEPREGDAVTVVVPYDEGPVLDEPFGMAGERRVFVG